MTTDQNELCVHNSNSNNSINVDNVYGAVIMTVHSVYLMNVAWHQVAAKPRLKPTSLSCASACSLLSFTLTNAISFRLVHKLILILEGRRLHRPSKGVQPVSKAVYRSGFVRNTQAGQWPQCDRSWDLVACSHSCYS